MERGERIKSEFRPETILYLALAGGFIYLAYKAAEKFLAPGFGERELEQRVKLLLEELKFEKENLGKLSRDQIEKYISYYKADASTNWNYLKSLRITIDPNPAKFESDISTWPIEEQAIAWKTYDYNILSRIGLALYNNPYLELAKNLGLAAIIGLVSASVIKKLIEEWRKPPPPPETKGTLRVQSDPGNAEVYVDGIKVGSAGSIRDGTYRDYIVVAGLRSITFKLAGYRDRNYSVDIAADQVNFVSAVLFPITLPSAVRYVTLAGARGNVNELWFDVMPAEKKVAHYEKGELVQIVEITKEYLDFIYQWNPNAWRHCFELYWGHPYEYYYPPPQPAPQVFTLDISTQDLAGYLVVGAAAAAALGWLAYEFIVKASSAVGVYAGATLQFSRAIYNLWGDRLITWAKGAFPEYNIEVA
jgi:hypothetical protein